jgi:hypothetical protein
LFNNTTPRANPINLGLNSTIANNTTTTAVVVQSQTKNNDSISFKTTLESIAPPAGTFLTPLSLTKLDISQKSNFTFGSGSPLCPTNDCKQEVIGGFYDISRPLSPVIQGTLKIGNKTTSTPDTIKYSMIAFVGSFQTTGTEEIKKYPIH